MTTCSETTTSRLLILAAGQILIALSLFFTLLSISEQQVSTDPFWASFLTLRQPLMLAVSSILILAASRHLSIALRWRIVRTDLALHILIPLIIAVHAIAPHSQNPRLLIGLVYLGFLTAKSALLAAALLIQQRRRPATVLMLFFALTWFYGQFGAWYGPVHSIHGDEPHYLMMTHSIVHDGDINLFNQYQEKTYIQFNMNELEPKQSDYRSGATIYSRGLGATFPMILAPAYAFGGMHGAQIFMILCTICLIIQLYLLLMRNLPNSQWVLAAVLLIASTHPVLTYSTLIYPDIPAALLIVTGLRVLQIHPLSRQGRSVSTWIFLISAGLLFLKFRYFIPVLLLLTPVIAREMRRIRSAVVLTIALGTLAGFYIVGDQWFFDGDLFFNRFGGVYQLQSYLPTFQSLKVVPGLLLDQESGFLFYAPLYLLVIAGLMMYRGKKDILYWVAVLGIPLTTASLLGHFAWHCLPTPPLRYMLPLLPPTALFLVTALKEMRKRSIFYRWIINLFVCGSWFSIGVCVLNPERQINLADGSARFLEELTAVTGLPVPLFFPSLIRPSSILWLWLLPAATTLCILTIPKLRDAAKTFHRIQPAGMMSVMLGIILLFGVCMASVDIAVYNCEDRWWTIPDGGSYFPKNRDPFFHQETRYGWQLGSGQSLQVPILNSASHATGILKARLIDSWRPQQLKIQTSEDRTEIVLVTSKSWNDYAFKIPRDTKLTEMRISSAATGDQLIAIDSIKIVKHSELLSGAWSRAADFCRLAGFHRLVLKCHVRALLTTDADPWRDFSEKFHRGAKPLQKNSGDLSRLDSEYLDRIYRDALAAGWKDMAILERMYRFSFRSHLPGTMLREYALEGIQSAHQPSVFLVIDLARENPEDEDLQLYSFIAHYLRGQTYKSLEILDKLLIRGRSYPMRMTCPGSHLLISHPLYMLLQDLESDTEYQELARILSERHLVDSIGLFHEGKLREAAGQFDNYYLSDYGFFMEKIPMLQQEYVAAMLQYATRIHTNHARDLVESGLINHKPLIAQAAAVYGLRMNPGDEELRFGEARALFHQQAFDEARKICLHNVILDIGDDRSRWLLEQVLVQMRENSLYMGGTGRKRSSSE